MPEETALTIIVPPALPSPDLAVIAHIADGVGSNRVLDDYHNGLTKETRRQRADLALFAQFLSLIGVAPGNFFAALST